MEDYKKKYEHALDNFKKIKASNKDNNELVDFIEYEYPELKESEDEKIRKWIVDELKDSLHTIEALYSGDYDNRDNDDIIREGYLRKALAWLEKRGDKTHEEKVDEVRPQSHKWYIKKGHWYMCIVDKPEYGWTKGKVYQSPEDNRIETDYKGDLTNWPDSEPWFRPATTNEIPNHQPHWKPSEEQMKALEYYIEKDIIDKEGVFGKYIFELYAQLKKLK